MRSITFLALVLALGASTACGKSEQQKQIEAAAEQASKAADELGKAADQMANQAQGAGGDMQKSAEDFAKAMGGFASAMAGGDGKTVEPVSFRDLQATLPAMSGWEMEKPRGERMTSPVPFSETSTSYRKGDSEIRVKIVDSGFNKLLIAPWTMFLSAGYEKETDRGYEKSTKVSGNPGFEKWDSEGKDGELNFVVSQRFLVTVEGNGLADSKPLYDVASKMDLGKLAALDTSAKQ